MIAAMDPQQTTALEKEVQELAEAVSGALGLPGPGWAGLPGPGS